MVVFWLNFAKGKLLEGEEKSTVFHMFQTFIF